MKVITVFVMFCTFIPLGLGLEPYWANPLKREDLGRTVKFTCVVDKVMQAHKKWVTEEWMIKDAAEAGFNIYSPRIGYDKLDVVAQVTAWCKQYGIFHLPWMRGTLNVALDNPAGEGKRVVWADGTEQPLWSPNSDELWAWMTQYITAYAELSAKDEHLLGVFLDFENYAPGKQGNLYSLSYDRLILDKFAAAEGIEIPALAPAEREPWLREQKLHEKFEAFQIAHWRERCRTLRQAVDALDPGFQFWLYPVPGPPFLQEAAYREWTTEAAPMVIADQTTYGRPSSFLTEQEALQANRASLEKYEAIPKAMGVPYLYSGGIDPVVRGADAEFCGKNAVMISDATDGYWIFYEGPEYTTTHADYWKWFTWANRTIAEGRFEAQREPRQTDEGFVLDLLKRIDTTGFADADAIGKDVELPLRKLRGANLLLMACKAGQEVALELKDIPVGDNTVELRWDLRTPKFEKSEAGAIAHNESGEVRFTPTENGVYFLGVSSGACSYAVTRANVPVAWHAGEFMGTIHGEERFYFFVPEGTAEYKFHVKGSGAETVRVNVYDPEGTLAGTAQTSTKEARVTLPVKPGAKAGAVWSFALVKADEGTLEDALVKIEGIAPLVSYVPEHAFRPGK
ncbi:MAG: hypothetical protein IT364_15475 [Candidatus Hydrogenedentes bacterium]|nr:hypothetical protein [Candidatus Hydrogenedentota bacterium]